MVVSSLLSSGEMKMSLSWPNAQMQSYTDRLKSKEDAL
jgi:hypothetical protein